jgi:xanthine dehydrogenase accessory factor
MKEIVEIVRFWRARRDQPLALATLVRTRGSSYRRPGARMLISSDGASAGSLSAGCIEEEVISCAHDVIHSGRPRLLVFDTRRRFGCNGSIEVFVERVCDEVLAALQRTLNARTACEIATVFENSDALGTRLANEFCEPRAFVQMIAPTLRLTIVGGGNEATALANQAQLLGWEVFVIEAIPLLRETVDERTAAVVATHNFGRDCAALRYLLPLGLRYVGLVGPRRRRDEILIDLIDSGAELNSQFFSPAGLHLAADSPEEIALAVAAEIQCVFAGGTAEHLRNRKAPIHASVTATWETSAQ